ncbi:MAG: response regulator [Stenotrophomonas sp.]|uniref:response regulator n=1 Tax=Stenotrophomonas sp. TaxID=69392 RepID=UPI003D6CB627
MSGIVGIPDFQGNVLVVEDEIELSRLFVEVITDAGYTAVPTYSLSDALGVLSQQHFDAAVLDIELRDGTVFPVADRLAELGTPFLFASAVYSQMVPQRHRDVPFVAKPFRIEDLLAGVKAAMQGGA